jgi:hypothetical protein
MVKVNFEMRACLLIDPEGVDSLAIVLCFGFPFGSTGGFHVGIGLQ